MVDHTVPNTKFLAQYNINLARQVALCSQLRLRFEQEVRLLKKARTQVARREERIKAVFKECKKYEDDKVEKRCAKMDARLDALSIDFDEELYPYMLTAIAGMSDGLEYGVKHEEAKLDLATIEAYDPEADNKYIAALHALKDLKYPAIPENMLHNGSVRFAPCSSQLTVPVYPKVRHPKDPWACKEEILLGDAIAANISRAEKKKKCRVVCRTHGIGSAHHARSDGVPVSVPTVTPQGLAILLADAATQTHISEDEASPRLLRS
ncbi:hypothetical protein Tco_1559665 [Tanacetum coccineum]